MAHDSIIDEHILNIIQTQSVQEQSELQKYLHARGHNIPQATLSRRLKKLKIAKVEGAYKAIELNKPNLPLILNIQVSEFGLIVLHTHPSHAHALAYYLDNTYVSFQADAESNTGILGTISGDDTVLIIVKNKERLSQVLTLLLKDFPYLNVITA